MHVFVFNHPDDFPEIRAFVVAMNALYGLAVEDCSGDFKEGLIALLGRTGAKAIFLGTRKCGETSLLEMFLPLPQGNYLRIYCSLLAAQPAERDRLPLP